MKSLFALLSFLFCGSAFPDPPVPGNGGGTTNDPSASSKTFDQATNALRFDAMFIYASGDFDTVYNIDICTDDSLTNWVFGTNIIGNGTNSPPEVIDDVSSTGNKFYRINPE